MENKRILRASKALWQLEKAQDRFNEAMEMLSDTELKEWAKQNEVTIEPSKQKLRVQALIENNPKEEGKVE